MRLAEARELFRQLAKEYFQTATVIFGRQSRIARPDMPLVSITHGDVTRCQFPPRMTVSGVEVASYPTKVNVRVDLFTHGGQVMENGTPIATVDTAIDDMLAFSNFLESPYATDWCAEHDIAIATNGAVKDLTGILNETNYEYRSQLNLTLYFIQRAVGRAGILGDESIKYDQNPPPDPLNPGGNGGGEGGEGGNGGGEGPDVPTPPEPNYGTKVPTIKVSVTGVPGKGTDSKDSIDDETVKVEAHFTRTPSGGGNEDLAGTETGYFTDAEITELKEGKET